MRKTKLKMYGMFLLVYTILGYSLYVGINSNMFGVLLVSLSGLAKTMQITWQIFYISCSQNTRDRMYRVEKKLLGLFNGS